MEELRNEVIKALDKIRPYLQNDGGDITLVDIEDGKIVKRKWLSKYRLIVMDDSTYEEKTSFRLSRLNIFVFGSLFAFVLIALTTVLIIYSPLRQYILGYTAVENKRETLSLLFKVDSLEQKIQDNDKYLASIKKVLVGDLKPQRDKDTASFNISDPKYDPKAYRVTPNRQDSILRQEVEADERGEEVETTTP